MKSKKISYRLFFSFPVQLVIMQIKYNQLQLLYWLSLFGFITGTFLDNFGSQYLFLDPEYLGKVNWLSFLIIGAACGGFIMAFNLSSYLLNSHRFPFLATLSRTFYKYSLNNLLIPVAFVTVYVYKIINFQYAEEFKPLGEVLVNVASFLAGFGIIVYMVYHYFLFINTDIYKMHGIKISDEGSDHAPMQYRNFIKQKDEWKSKYPNIWPVETYIASFTKLKLVRDTSHYKKEMIESVLRQNHVNAAVFEIVVFVSFFSLGLLSDFDVVRIPAGASVFLLFTLFIMISGVFRFYLKSWAFSGVIIFLILLNYLSQFRLFNSPNAAYGLNYNTEKAVYDNASIQKITTKKLFDEDVKSTIGILENWKAKWQARGVEKPKMILLNVSGGGVRSMLFTFRSLQVLDSMLHGDMMNYTSLITGSSGGVIGVAYYRQLFLDANKDLMKSQNDIQNIYLQNISRDLLNAPAFSISTNDLFFSFLRFSDGKYRYPKDRAYAWEHQLNENTGYVLDKRLRDFYKPEYEAKIPMLFMTPVIVNDGRGLFISPQKISYMTHSFSDTIFDSYSTAHGIELIRMFEKQDAANLKFTSALRINSTFPYVSPAVQLPSEPMVEVLDAGMRDNFGIKNSLRFLYVFKNWIKQNTSGVVMVQIRDTYKFPSVEEDSIKTVYQKFTAPFRGVAGNLIKMQDYNNDDYLEYVNSCFDGNLNFVMFQIPDVKDHAPISWHLTEREKANLKREVYTEYNKRELLKLKKLLSN